jgi:Pyruvate/2-oxoacid:ferredoxin oxidoreductase delta subunit
MPAKCANVEEAKREGVRQYFLATPTRIRRVGSKIEMECIRMTLSDKFDAKGRRIPKPVPESEFNIKVDTIISAIGQVPDIPPKFGLGTTDRGTLEVIADTFGTTKKGVFAGGDAVRGPASIIEAIVDGRRAAVLIDKYLGGRGIIDEVLAPPESTKMPQVGLSYYDRVLNPSLSINERLASFAEVELSITKEMAREEATRCLWCDLEPVVMDALKCAECRCCQLACSFAYTGAFNPQKAKISIETPIGTGWEREISFTDECVKCSVCARTCTYEVLSMIKIGGR